MERKKHSKSTSRSAELASIVYSAAATNAKPKTKTARNLSKGRAHATRTHHTAREPSHAKTRSAHRQQVTSTAAHAERQRPTCSDAFRPQTHSTKHEYSVGTSSNAVSSLSEVLRSTSLCPEREPDPATDKAAKHSGFDVLRDG